MDVCLSCGYIDCVCDDIDCVCDDVAPARNGPDCRDCWNIVHNGQEYQCISPTMCVSGDRFKAHNLNYVRPPVRLYAGGASDST